MSATAGATSPRDVAVLAGAFVVYALYRHAFVGLPLHRDTGFYVPNYSVATRRFGPFRGWNTYFSGGSRALPQFVHTALYLGFGSRRYAGAFRLFYTAVSFATACLSAQFATLLLPQFAGLFWVVLVLALALFAETQYGSYFESAEVFQVLAQVAGVLLTARGIQADSSWLTSAGLACLWIDAVGIKLTGAGVAGCVSCAVIWSRPGLWPAVLLPGVLAVLAYVGWVALSKVGFRRLGEYMARHEAYVRRNYPSQALLQAVKLGFAARLWLRNPVWLVVVLGGLLCGAYDGLAAGLASPTGLLAAAHGVGLVAGFARQGHRVWYYLIPFLPGLALGVAAALYCAPLRAHDPLWLALGVAGLSVVRNGLPRVRLDPDAFNRHVWSVYDRPGHPVGSEMARGNQRVAEIARDIHAQVAGHSMLVVGPHNQASLLCDAAYDTPLTTLCDLTSGVIGDPAPWLGEAMRERPPEFVLDTEGGWEALASELDCAGLYHPVREAADYRLLQRGSPPARPA